MDWATVAANTITGVVGIAGVAGAILAAKIAGNSARQTVRLSISAESDRARLAEKRRIYARAIAALDAGFLAARSVASASTAISETRADPAASDEDRVEAAGKLTLASAKWQAAFETATYAVSELQLIAPLPVGELAHQAHDALTDRDPHAESRNTLMKALLADLDKEAQQSTLPE